MCIGTNHLAVISLDGGSLSNCYLPSRSSVSGLLRNYIESIAVPAADSVLPLSCRVEFRPVRDWRRPTRRRLPDYDLHSQLSLRLVNVVGDWVVEIGLPSRLIESSLYHIKTVTPLRSENNSREYRLSTSRYHDIGTALMDFDFKVYALSIELLHS